MRFVRAYEVYRREEGIESRFWAGENEYGRFKHLVVYNAGPSGRTV